MINYLFPIQWFMTSRLIFVDTPTLIPMAVCPVMGAALSRQSAHIVCRS